MTGVAKSSTGAISLPDIAREIRVEHEQAQAAFDSALEHAIRAGELLTNARADIEHGAWLPWLSENVDFTRQTAAAYMRLHANRDRLQMEGAASISAALKQFAAPKEDQEVPVEGDVVAGDLREIAARIDSGELSVDEARDLFLGSLDPFERYWLKHKGIVSSEQRAEAIRETCEVAGVVPMIEDLSETDSTYTYVWVGYAPADEGEIGNPLTFHPGWAHYCRHRLGDDVRFATTDLMPYHGPVTEMV